MSRIQPESLAVAAIFPSHDAVSPSELVNWIGSRGFGELSRPQIPVQGQGVQISGQPPLVAENGEVQILFEPQANIHGFGNATFVTVKEGTSASFDKVLSEMEEIYSGFDELGIRKDVGVVEITYQGRVRVERERELTKYIDGQKLDAIEDATGTATSAVAARFEADSSATKAGWYRFLVDAGSVGSANLWRYKLLRRYDSYEEVDEEDADSIITSFIEQA